MHHKKRHLLSRNLCCAVLLVLDAQLTVDGAIVVRPFKRIHDAVPKALTIPGQITVGDIVQMKEIVHEVAHDAEVVRCAVIVAEGSEFARSQAAHTGYLGLSNVRKIGNYPFERFYCNSIAFVVEREREWTMGDEVRKYEKG